MYFYAYKTVLGLCTEGKRRQCGKADHQGFAKAWSHRACWGERLVKGPWTFPRWPRRQASEHGQVLFGVLSWRGDRKGVISSDLYCFPCFEVLTLTRRPQSYDQYLFFFPGNDNKGLFRITSWVTDTSTEENILWLFSLKLWDNITTTGLKADSENLL